MCAYGYIGYLHDAGTMNIDRVRILFSHLAKYEKRFFEGKTQAEFGEDGDGRRKKRRRMGRGKTELDEEWEKLEDEDEDEEEESIEDALAVLTNSGVVHPVIGLPADALHANGDGDDEGVHVDMDTGLSMNNNNNSNNNDVHSNTNMLSPPIPVPSAIPVPTPISTPAFIDPDDYRSGYYKSKLHLSPVEGMRTCVYAFVCLFASVFMRPCAYSYFFVVLILHVFISLSADPTLVPRITRAYFEGLCWFLKV